MKRNELLKALKELKEGNALTRTYRANMKTSELETIYNESMKEIEREMNEMKENTKKEITLDERMKEMFKDARIKKAHGGFAVIIDNKRAFEITQSKRTNLYKICTHKDTTHDSKLRNLTRYRNQDIEVQEQKYCFAFKNLDDDAMQHIANKVYETKAIKIAKYNDDAKDN